jgi:ATP-dependent helicase HrpA
MHITFPEILPIANKKEEIVQAIASHQVLVIAGDTGSGKTTQLPKMCLLAGRGKKGIIGCTQPRRIAAVSVAQRVCEEIGDTDTVGYKIRFSDHTSDVTRIKFMTDGILLAETRSNRNLNQYDTIIIDEAHERSLNIDFLLGYLHQLLAVRKDLKLIISSATLDTQKFSSHFFNAPIIEVSGRTYPVDICYRDEQSEDVEEQTMVEQAVREVIELADRPGGGDILVFMPTERDILDTVDLVRKKMLHPAQVLPLFGRLQGRDQKKIFQKSSLRKIIIATNVAETSLTVPGIKAVVDTGVARIAQYNVKAGTTSLPVKRVSRASCDQRAGRCGRTAPGTCIRLYSEENYLSRPEFTLPELLRSNLAGVILQMISLGLGDPRKFPFLEPPSPRAINDGYRILRELGAVTKDNKLTKRGGIMAGLPLDPRISRMIIAGAELGCLREITIIAALLSIQDPRIRPADKLEQARQAHHTFHHPGSDVLGFVSLWDKCRQTMQGKQSARGLKKFCKKFLCSWQRMREWFDIHDQILRIIKSHKGFALNTDPAKPSAVHQALTSGFLRHIGMRKKKNIYQISGNREAVLFPGSALHNSGGQWIVATEFVETSQLFARVAANIDVQWLEKLGGELCKRSWSDPHWQKKAGQVVALEKVTLFGMVICAGKRVNYGRINKKTAHEARQIFIREALVQGELRGNYPFLQHNLDLASRFTDMEERLRRRGIMMDEQVLYDFYDKRLGVVYDRFTLNRELKQKRSERSLLMTENDICMAAPATDELYRFPDTLQTNQGALKLSYRFQPGHKKDGVTVEIPVHACQALSSTVFEWLVPGLLEEKILFLLKGLPKRLRKLFVPLPNAVDRILDSLDIGQESLYPALERVILRNFQVNITRADWQLDNLPAHLRMRFQLVDGKGKILHSCRSFHELTNHCQQTKAPKGRVTTGKLPSFNNITSWDFSPAPGTISHVDKQTGSSRIYFPVLTADRKNNRLRLDYISNQNLAREQNRDGIRFLFEQAFAGEIRAIKKECKAAITGHSASWISLGVKATAAEVKEQLLDCILNALFLSEYNSDVLPDAAQLQAQIKNLKQPSLTQTARKYLNELLDLLVTRRKIQTTLNSFANRAAKSKSKDQEQLATFQQLLNDLVPHNFLTTVPPQDYTNKKRYLLALGLRMERAEHSPAKDIIKEKRIMPFSDRTSQLHQKNNHSYDCQQAIQKYREMVEEFRISVFAPELGTRYPVSEKRLKRLWKKLENSCRTME